MRIREYNPGDLDSLRKMHAAQSFGYPFPDLDSPLFVSRLVLEEELKEETDAAVFPVQNNEAKGREERDDSSPLTISSRGRSHRVTMAILQRLTAETYLLHDPAVGTPRERWQQFVALHEAARRDAATRGLDDVQAFLPPRIARAFGRRLSRLGWTNDPWPCFSLRLS